MAGSEQLTRRLRVAPRSLELELHLCSSAGPGPSLVLQLVFASGFTLIFTALWKHDRIRTDGERADAPFRLVARTHDVSEAQLLEGQMLLRWGVQTRYAFIFRRVRPNRIRQNAELFGFELDDENLAAIDQTDLGHWVARATGDPTKTS